MKYGVRRIALGILTSSLCLSGYSLFRAPLRARAATPQQPPPVKANTQTGGGLLTTTFDTLHGRVIVHLPDDMRAGDTVSGTVTAEPKGNTEEARTRNRASLEGYVVEVGDQKVPTSKGDFTWKIPSPSPTGDLSSHIIKVVDGTRRGAGEEVARTTIPVPSTPLIFIPIIIPRTEAAPAQTDIALPHVKAIDGTRLNDPGGFQLPTMGQQGRPVEIFGPFDGNTSNTNLRFGPAGSTVQDFEKNTESVSGGFGRLRPLAESPRKVVFESPTNVTGPVEIVVREGVVETKDTYRSVGVRLSAPKTNLLRGERTTLTVEVSGLQGIKEDVPLQLDTRGVVQMDGGNFQNLRIRPQEIKADGRYTTARAITGQQAGAFTVTATVIVRPFDVCLQDDTRPASVMMWNSFNGAYYIPLMTHRGVSPTGQTQTGGGGQVKPNETAAGTPPGGFTGTGKIAMKGCIITLSHNAPDRRVMARLDTCGTNGDFRMQASVPQQLAFTDSNTADSVCAAPGLTAPVKSKDELLKELEKLRENKRYDCEHGRQYQEAMAARIAEIKRVLRSFHGMTVLNDPIDANCPPKK